MHAEHTRLDMQSTVSHNTCITGRCQERVQIGMWSSPTKRTTGRHTPYHRPSTCRQHPTLGLLQLRPHAWFSNVMDGQASEPLVNRNEAIPIISITGPEDYVTTPEAGRRLPSKRDVLRQALPIGKLKEKLECLSSQAEMPDRLFTMYRYHLRSRPNTVLTLILRLLQQILPSQDIPEDSSIKDRRFRKYVDRPGFSLPVMSNNFRRFNARHALLLPTAASLSLTSSVELELRLSSKIA